MNDNKHITYNLKNDYVDFRETTHRLGSYVFDKWNGRELNLPEAPDSIRALYMNDYEKYRPGFQEMRDWKTQPDMSILVRHFAIHKLEDHPNPLSVIARKQLTKDNADIILHGREDLMFFDASLYGQIPGFVLDTLNAYERKYRIEHYLRYLVHNEKLRAYHFDLSTGKYTDSPSEAWGTSKYSPSSLNSRIEFPDENGIIKPYIIVFKRKDVTWLTSNADDRATPMQKPIDNLEVTPAIVFQTTPSDTKRPNTTENLPSKSSTVETLMQPTKKALQRIHPHIACIERISNECEQSSYMNVWYALIKGHKEGKCPEINRIENDVIHWNTTVRKTTKKSLQDNLTDINSRKRNS